MIFVAGLLIFLITQGFALGQVPGLHFDEAWAANTAYRIAFEPGFWPVQGQSAYTVPWNLYPVALAFRVFWPSVAVFRGVGLAYVLLGFLGIRSALRTWGEKQAGDLFILVASFFLGLSLNHRFAIELNTFHVLCFGWLLWAMTRFSISHSPAKRRWIGTVLIAAVFFGVSSHVLFLAPVAAALLAAFTLGKPLSRDLRSAAVGAGIFLFPFFARIAIQVPEHDKAVMLFLGYFVALVAIFFWSSRSWGTPAFRKKVENAVLMLWIPFLFLTFFFLEGHWSVLFSVGSIRKPILAGLSVLPSVLLLVVYRALFREGRARTFLLFSAYLGLLIGAMMLKPTPRYFEMAELTAVIAVAYLLSKVPRSVRGVYFVIVPLFFCLQIGENVLIPGLRGQAIESHFRFLFLKDDSRDNLSKQKLAALIGSWGCRFDAVHSADSRVLEALKFLSHTPDWKVNDRVACPEGGVQVSRAAEADHTSGDRIMARAYGFTVERVK